MTTPTGSYLCPHCGRTTRTREDDPKNCVKCGHIMYWRPDDEGGRCTFCGCGEDDHYWFCVHLDEVVYPPELMIPTRNRFIERARNLREIKQVVSRGVE